MKLSKHLSAGLKLLCTTILLALVLKSVDLAKIRQDLQSLDLVSLALLLAACWAGQLLCAERWRILAAAMHMPGTYSSYVQMYFAGMFCNIGLPSLVGGDAVKAYVASRRSGKPLQIGIASVLEDRAVGLLSLLLYGSASILIHPFSWKGIPLGWIYLICWAAIAAVFVLVWHGGKIYRGRLGTLRDAGRAKWLQTAIEFHQALELRKMRRRDVFRVLLYSFINSALVLWIFQHVIFAAGQKVGIVPFSALYPLVTLATMLPITLSGIGVREWVYVEALALMGIPRESGLMIALATSALGLACNLGGAVCLPCIPRNLRLESQNTAARN